MSKIGDLYLPSLDKRVPSDLQAKSVYDIAYRIKDVIEDDPLVFCSIDYGAWNEHRTALRIFDDVFGEDGYVYAVLTQARRPPKKEGGDLDVWRPITAEVIDENKLGSIDSYEDHPLGNRFKPSGRYIFVKEETYMGKPSIPADLYPLPDNIGMFLLADDWASGGGSALGYLKWALDYKDEIRPKRIATMTSRDATGLVNYTILLNPDILKLERSPRQLARKRLKGFFKPSYFNLIPNERLYGALDSEVAKSVKIMPDKSSDVSLQAKKSPDPEKPSGKQQLTMKQDPRSSFFQRAKRYFYSLLRIG